MFPTSLRLVGWIAWVIGCLLSGTAASAAPNLVRNGDFSNGRLGWSFYSNGAAAFQVTDAEAQTVISIPGSNVQLLQAGLGLQGDTEYRLRFRARNTIGDTVTLRLLQHTAPYTDYGLRRSFQLSPAEGTYEVSFRTTSGDKTNARLMFWMAGRNGTFYFDDIVLEKVAIHRGDDSIA